MYLATTTGDFGGYTPLQTQSMEYIHQSGFSYLDYNFGSDYARRDGVYSENWKDYLQTIREKAEELSVKFIQAHSPMGAPIAEGNDAFTEDTIRCVEACGILEIPNIVVHSGYTKGLTVAETFEKNKIFYEKLFPMAEKYGVNILVENFNKMCVPSLYWLDNAEDQRALIEYVNHPLFHGCWDAGHGNMQEMTQADSLRILGEHVYALHIQDNMGNDDSHMAPFFGTLNLDSLMHGLLDIGYKGYFTFESGNILLPSGKRRPYEEDTRLLKAPLELRIEAEKFMYAIGKTILSAYDCFEG